MNRFAAISVAYVGASYIAGIQFLFNRLPTHGLDFGPYVFLASPLVPPFALSALVRGRFGALSVDSVLLFLSIFLIAFGLILTLLRRKRSAEA